MIPVWDEDSELTKEFGQLVESCVFCGAKTRTWHENTNNPVCLACAKKHRVSDIPEDHGERIRARKREGTFDRGDSTRAN